MTYSQFKLQLELVTLLHITSLQITNQVIIALAATVTIIIIIRPHRSIS